MNIGLGFYEIFARIVPGAFYLLALLQLGSILKIIPFDWQAFNGLGIVPSLGLTVIAYILGTALYPVSILWHRLFKPKNVQQSAFIEFQKRNPGWKFDFDGKDWRMLFALIRKGSPDTANAIDKQNALYIMLASISFGIILLAINQIVMFFVGGTYLNIIYFVLLIAMSLLVAREGRFFQARFYHLIFETILSHEIKLENLVKRDSETAVRGIKKE